MKKRLRISIMFILFFCANAVLSVPKYKITFIHAYDSHFHWSQESNRGLQDGFKDQNMNVDIHMEYLSSRKWDYRYEEIIMRRILQRAEDWKTDLIVVSENPSLLSLLLCHSTYAHKVPIVYTSNVFADSNLLAKYPNISGFNNIQDFDSIFKLAKQMFPKKNKFIVVKNSSTMGKEAFNNFERSWMHFKKKNPTYRRIYLKIQEDSLISCINMLRLDNKKDKLLLVPFGSNFFIPLMKICIYPCLSSDMDTMPYGAFASFSIRKYDLAYQAALRASLILQKTNTKNLNKPFHFKRYLVCDWKQLKFFNYPKFKLPPQTIIINQPFNDKYFSLISIISFLLLLILALVIYFSINHSKKESRKRMLLQANLIAQSSLVKQRNDFESFFDSILFGEVSLDENNCIHMINSSALQLLRIPSEKKEELAINQPINSLIEIINEDKNILPDLLNSLTKKNLSIPIPRKSTMKALRPHITFSVSGDLNLISSGTLKNEVILSFMDTTDERIMNEMLDLTMKAGKIFTFDFDVNTEKLTFSHGFMESLGLPSYATTINLNEFENEYIHPDDIDTAEKTIKDLCYIQGVNTFHKNFPIRLKDKDNRYNWWLFDLNIFSLDNIKMDKMLGVCTNIQQYKNREAELMRARDKAVQSDRLKTEFIGNISHEIRTPLNAIVGFSELLTDINSYTPEEGASYVSIINKNCSNLLMLIDNLIDLSSIESGAIEFTYSPVDLNPFINEIVDLQSMSIKKEVTLKMDLPNNSKVIRIDHERLRQVLYNILNNANKFTSEGSITIGYRDENHQTRFFVEDTGIGISEDKQQKIFDRFYKVDDFIPGTGIGLAICKTILEHFHGDIKITSKVNRGTIFEVIIPDNAGDFK